VHDTSPSCSTEWATGRQERVKRSLLSGKNGYKMSLHSFLGGKAMKKLLIMQVVATSMLMMSLPNETCCQAIQKEDCIFLSGLHYTAKGMAYWYDKANGGIETITGIPYHELACQNCHVRSCDVCHKSETSGKFFYSTETAQNPELCLKCHAREASIMKMDKAAGHEDVHFANGMKCVDCHSGQEIHGDGVEYNSMKQAGAMDIKCEGCHETVSKSISHTVHGEKLDCKACHVRQVVSCLNCHFDTMVKQGKRVATPVSDWVFLMNDKDGKVTSANTQTFVVGDNKTFLIFAPQYSHSIQKDGRKCNDCHATDIVKQVKKGKTNLLWREKGEIQHAKGIIPVVADVKYNFIYQSYEDGKWVPISNPLPPELQYVGFGEPLSREQLDKLAQRKSSK
jgi:hypothetical protein